MNEVPRPPEGAVRVGGFVFDPRSGELRDAEGHRQTLSTQPLQLLLALSERPGALVTRDELRARLWPADTYVDFEHGLNAAVKRLRDALGDSADTPRYIETVPRRGYRLIAPVDPAARPEDEPSDPAKEASDSSITSAVPRVAAPTPGPALRGRRGLLLAVAAVAAATVFAAFIYFGRERPAEAALRATQAPVDAHPIRLTFGPGLQTDAAWAPDGRRIAFAWDRDGNFDIFTQRLDGGEPTRITSSRANETQPAWSPDGRQLVFSSDEDGGGLFTVVVDGGLIRRIAAFGSRPVWMPRGRDIVFADARIEALYLVRADGGEAPREILKGQLAGGRWGSFAVHPDGRIGVIGNHPTRHMGFYVSDGAHTRLDQVDDRVVPLGPQHMVARVHWSPSGDAIFLEARVDGVPTIGRVEVDPTTLAWRNPVRLTAALTPGERAAISPDGARLAFTSAQASIRATVFPFEADRGRLLGDGRAVTDEDAAVAHLSIAADGSAILYTESRPGGPKVRGLRQDLATGKTTVLAADVGMGPVQSRGGRAVSYLIGRPLAGSAGAAEYALAWRDAAGLEQLLSPWATSVFAPSDWRHDDRAVLGTFMERAHQGPAALAEWAVGASASARPSRILLASPRHQLWQGQYSPDGRWVSFVAMTLDRVGTIELGIAPADSRSASTWTRAAADHGWPDKPRWSPSGQTLYFLSPAPSGYYNVWGIRFDIARGTPAGAPFQVTHFDSARWHVDPNTWNSALGVAKGRLVLPMRAVRGSIWLRPTAGT